MTTIQELSQAALNRPVRPCEVQYMLDQMPYLQIVNAEFDEDNLFEPELVKANTGWVIQNFQGAICSSPGRLLWTNNSENDDDGGAGGTVISKAFNTALEMIDLADQIGWDAVNIAFGHRTMQLAAWIGAQHSGLGVVGFTPTAEEVKKSERVLRNAVETAERAHKTNK